MRRAIKCSLSDAVFRHEPVELPEEITASLQALRASRQPLALMISQADAAAVRAVEDLVVSGLSKYHAKGLADKIERWRTGRSPLFEAEYVIAGKARSSVKTLLVNAVKKQVNQLFIVAVPEGIFNDLYGLGALDAAQDARPQAIPAAGPLTQPDDEARSECDPLTVIPPAPGEDALRKDFWGSSDQARLVRRLIVYAARAVRKDPVLIVGETGTGKEKVANLIHLVRYGEDRSRPFVPLNCTELPESLVESELFGSVKGVYTDATDRSGIWESASGGTLFFDEIGEMPLSQQAKLLRALQENAVRRLGDSKVKKVDVRIISATHRDLYAMVQRGLFREDLYYRLRGFLVRTPALREHPQDLVYFIKRIWGEFAVAGIENGREIKRPDLTDEVVRVLAGYGWPGNVRQLKHFISAIDNHFPPGGSPPTAVRVKVLANTFGFSLDALEPSVNPAGKARPGDIGLHRAQCLRHLKVVVEVLEATRRVFAQVAATRRGSQDLAEELKAGLRRASTELASQCLPEKRLYFHHQNTFLAVNSLNQKISAFACGMEGDSLATLASWAQGISGEVDSIISTVFREVEAILEKG